MIDVYKACLRTAIIRHPIWPENMTWHSPGLLILALKASFTPVGSFLTQALPGMGAGDLCGTCLHVHNQRVYCDFTPTWEFMYFPSDGVSIKHQRRVWSTCFNHLPRFLGRTSLTKVMWEKHKNGPIHLIAFCVEAMHTCLDFWRQGATTH